MGRRAKYLTKDERLLHIAETTLHTIRVPETSPGIGRCSTRTPLAGDDIVLSNEALPRWMAKPPFAMDEDETDPYSADYRFWTECLEAIIHGYRMRLQLEDDRQRRLDLTAKGWSSIYGCVAGEVFELLRNWEMVNIRMYHAYHCLQAVQNAQIVSVVAGTDHLPLVLPQIS
ncbi:hypothetical protein B0H14DRAFT_2655128 [Mycena olivaceomarginata]|nr:hypothetical protein B0H14DRAFT_2655128 [Mycena olivaceomarginata]